MNGYISIVFLLGVFGALLNGEKWKMRMGAKMEGSRLGRFPQLQALTLTSSLLVGMLVLLLSGCSGAEPETAPLRIGVLPILDALPLYVAESEGFFAEAGVQVTLIPGASAAERDQLLQAGQLDVGVRYAMQGTSTAPQFRILAAGNTDITTPEQLHGIQRGVSQGMVIESVTERLLMAEGLAATEIKVLAVLRIPERLALLGAGQISAAPLPEPLASPAVQQGAQVILGDTHHPQYSCSVFAFRSEVITAQPEMVRGFLTAIERASSRINADKARWDGGLLSAQKLVLPVVLGAYTLPDYSGAEAPTQEQFKDVALWLREKGLINVDGEYTEVIDDNFLL